MIISRHKTDFWIKNNSIDVSIKDIYGNVDIHWHEFYEIELILEGAGEYNIDGIDYSINKGSLFFMSPSSYHQIIFTENTKLINFMFEPEICNLNLLFGVFDNSPHASLNLSDSDIDLIHYLAKDMENTDSINYQVAILNCILAKIQRLHPSCTTSLTDPKFQRAVLYIQNHFKENPSLKSVAEISNYSTNYFSNKFKEHMGISFKKYILDLKFCLAQKKLENTNLSITEICYDCGFNDFSNFLTYFKKRYGMTPNKYRTLYAKKHKT